MSGNDSKGKGDDKVGYKRPPKASQFKPGRSGNPSGRPRGPREIDHELRALDYGEVTMRINGRSRKVPVSWLSR